MLETWKKKAKCLIKGHEPTYWGTEDKINNNPVYWMICDRCGKHFVGAIVASSGTTLVWQAQLYPKMTLTVHENALPDYAKKSKQETPT